MGYWPDAPEPTIASRKTPLVLHYAGIDTSAAEAAQNELTRLIALRPHYSDRVLEALDVVALDPELQLVWKRVVFFAEGAMKFMDVLEPSPGYLELIAALRAAAGEAENCVARVLGTIRLTYHG